MIPTFFQHAANKKRTEKAKKTCTTVQPKPKQLGQITKKCICKATEAPRPKLPDGIRRLKVYSKWKHKGAKYQPVIMLQGEWLRNAGFDHGAEILVTINKKQLIVNFEKDRTTIWQN